MKNKIGWCNTTWNPIWGCRNRCDYCYARIFSNRFRNIIADKEHKWSRGRICQGEIANRLRHFVPTLIYSHLYKKLPKKPQKIFVGSMSEINHWKNHWMNSVMERIKLYPQHTYQFLTKFPEVYLRYKFPDNCWLGVTITNTENCDYLEYQKFKISNPYNLKFVCFEPILNEIDINIEGIDWVILGTETGNRKNKIFAKRHWIEKILIDCQKKDIPVYVKDNIIKWQPQLKKFKEFPKIEL